MKFICAMLLSRSRWVCHAATQLRSNMCQQTWQLQLLLHAWICTGCWWKIMQWWVGELCMCGHVIYSARWKNPEKVTITSAVFFARLGHHAWACCAWVMQGLARYMPEVTATLQDFIGEHCIWIATQRTPLHYHVCWTRTSTEGLEITWNRTWSTSSAGARRWIQ